MTLRILIIMTFLLSGVNGLAAGGGHDAAPAAPVVTGRYAHTWTKFPPLELKTMDTAEALSREVQPGRVLAVAFIASWCIPCQQVVDDLQKLETQYRDKYLDLVYVFAHDTVPDARGFISFYKLNGSVYLGTAKLLETFHQPELPSLYVSDRYGWLLYRKLNLKETDFAELTTLLNAHTSF